MNGYMEASSLDPKHRRWKDLYEIEEIRDDGQ